MINYANQEVHVTGCPGCAYARHEFELPCGMAFENDRFTLSQDWELPIQYMPFITLAVLFGVGYEVYRYINDPANQEEEEMLEVKVC